MGKKREKEDIQTILQCFENIEPQLVYNFLTGTFAYTRRYEDIWKKLSDTLKALLYLH